MFWNLLGKNNTSNKTDWQYYKSESIYIKDEWGEIYVNDITKTSKGQGKITIKDGRSNPFMGAGYTIEIEGKFVNEISKENFIELRKDALSEPIYKVYFKDLIYEDEEINRIENGDSEIIIFQAPGFKHEEIWVFLKYLTESIYLNIYYGDETKPTVFPVEGLNQGLKNFKRGYTKI